MQHVTIEPEKTPAITPDRTKMILIVGSIFLIIPFPWDWVPVLGDVSDVAGFLLAAHALRNTPRANGGAK